MAVLSAPKRFMRPSFSWAGPDRISRSEPRTEVRTLAPRGRVGWKVAMPQWKPRAGASTADERGDPSMTGWVAQAGAGHVGDGGGLGDAEAKDAAGGAGVPWADPDQHADGAGAHQVQARLIRRAPSHDDGDVELPDEALEVERLARLRDVLGRHHRALNHQQVQLGGQDGLGQRHRALGRHRGGPWH